jgi:hypothetical protein
MVVIRSDGGAGSIVRLRVAVAGVPVAPCTWTVILVVPATVGVPLITPALLRLNPAGSAAEPAASDHVNGLTPPEACSVLEYGCPTTPLGREVVVMTGFAGRIVMVTGVSAVAETLSDVCLTV